ncbi:Conserved hypothetical protein [Candidatus Hamiltonella defensa (Bemisia tabaci)]|nr:Conserved hypothetical protein [Candidatus Hamiltonella defensa (Bemisia tabaci)]
MFSFKKWIFSVLNPEYQLILIEEEYSKKLDQTIYIFKQYGNHDFVKLTYLDILNNKNLLSAINPVTLMNIHLNEYLINKKKKSDIITKILRNNEYEILKKDGVNIYSGEYICQNISMFSCMNRDDICNIAYNSGFLKGRQYASQIKKQISNFEDDFFESEENKNIIPFKK